MLTLVLCASHTLINLYIYTDTYVHIDSTMEHEQTIGTLGRVDLLVPLNSSPLPLTRTLSSSPQRHKASVENTGAVVRKCATCPGLATHWGTPGKSLHLS